MTVYAQRRRKLLAAAKGKQVVALTPANLFYLTDFFGGGVGIVHPDRTVVVTYPLEADRAEEACAEAEIVVVKKRAEMGKALAKQLRKGGVVVDQIQRGLKAGRFEEKPELFLETRRFKDAVERDRIKEACARTDRVFRVLEEELKPGRSEWELAAEVMRSATEQEMAPTGSDSSIGPVIIASGPHGAYGHSELSKRKVKSGDFVVADLLFRYQGYNSDETRTFAVGNVTPEMKKAYAVVKEGQQAAIDAVREGVTCGSVHDAAVGVLRRHRMDRYLNHSVGHGVGIDIHEQPGIFHGNPVELGKNDVITDEPGVYLVGKFGVRIEDTLRVDRKPELYTKFTKDLVTCG